MQRNALRLQNLINQLLNLSKLESGQMKLHAMEVNLIKLVNGYVSPSNPWRNNVISTWFLKLKKKIYKLCGSGETGEDTV